MIIELKIKKAALSAAIEHSEKRVIKSPERYARNLVELIQTTYPGYIKKEQTENIIKEIVELCNKKNAEQIRILINKIIEEKTLSL